MENTHLGSKTTSFRNSFAQFPPLVPSQSSLAGVDLDSSSEDLQSSFDEISRPQRFNCCRRIRQCSTHGSFVLFLVVAVILVSGFDWVMWKKSLNRFHGEGDQTLTFFVLQLYVFLMLCLSGIACLVSIYLIKNVDHEMRQFPQSKFMIMSIFDTGATLCSSMAGAVVAGHIQTLLNQAMLSLVMIFSILILATEYTLPQYGGATLILGGALVAAIPSVHASDVSGRSTQAWGIILYSVGSVPYALGNVYREYLFKGRRELNIFYLMFWTSLYQFLLSFLTMPILSLEIFGGTPFSEFPFQFSNGFRCFFGMEVEGFTCHIGYAPGLYLGVYIALNFVVSILRLMLIKHASALLLQVTNAMALLSSNLLFCVPFIMGDDTEKFNVFDAIGLSIVMLGFVVFRAALFHKENLDKMREVQAAAYEVEADLPHSKSIMLATESGRSSSRAKPASDKDALLHSSRASDEVFVQYGVK